MARDVLHTKLYRSYDALAGGVCAGLAECFELDPIVVRILVVLLTGTTFGFAAFVYVALWACLPLGSEPRGPYDIFPSLVGSRARGNIDHPESVNREDAEDANARKLPLVSRVAAAAALMLLFLVVATNVSTIVPGTQWWQFWPLAFLIAGLCLIIVPVRSRFEAAWHALGIIITSLAASMTPMSLGIISWSAFPLAFLQGWPLVAVALALIGLGLRWRSDTLVVTGAFCIAAFCLVMLFAHAAAGETHTLFLNMPDGSMLRVAMGF